MRRDDDNDFTVFVAASSRRLLHTAFLITGDRDSAQDVLQTALERVYLRWGRISRRELPEAYARRVIVNAAIDLRRAARGRRLVRLDEALLPPLVDAALESVPVRDALLACVRGTPSTSGPSLSRAAVLPRASSLTPSRRRAASRSGWLGVSVGEREARRLGAVSRSGLGEDPVHVRLHGRLADV